MGWFNKNQLGAKKKIVLAYNSILQSVTVGKSRQELEVSSHILSQEQRENECIVSTDQCALSIYIQDPHPENGTAHS